MQIYRKSSFVFLLYAIYSVGLAAFANTRYIDADNILQSSILPILIIQTNGQNIVDQPKITARLGIIDHGFGILNNRNDPFNQYDGDIGIELRGESSMTFVKKSYLFETRDALGANRNVPLLGMPKENDWILYGPYVDKTLLRNSLIFHLGQTTGRYASRMRFCELVINDQYLGVYALMEKIKRDKNRVSIATINPTDTAGVQLTGGYIVRMDKPDSTYLTFNTGIRFPSRPQAKIQFFDPRSEELNSQQIAWFKQFMTKFESTIVSPTFNQMGTGYHEYIDAGSFIDFLLTGELALEVDKYKYSTYFFKEKDTDGGKLHAGPLWDFDLGFGNDAPWTYGQAGDVWQYLEKDIGRCYWWERLMQDSYFRNRCYSRWKYLRDHSFSDEAVVNYLDSCALVLDGPQFRNFTQWEIMGLKLYENTFVGQTYAQELAYLKSWTLNRLHWMDTNLIGFQLMPEAALNEVSEASNNYTRVLRLSLKDDYFNRKVFQNDDFKVNNDGIYITKDSIHYVNDSTVDVHLALANSGVTLTSEMNVTIRAKVLESGVSLDSKMLLVSGLEDNSERPEYQIISRGNLLLIRSRSAGSGLLLLELFDLTGRKVHQQSLSITSEMQANVNLSNGIYIVRLTDGNKRYQQRVVIK